MQTKLTKEQEAIISNMIRDCKYGDEKGCYNLLRDAHRIFLGIELPEHEGDAAKEFEKIEWDDKDRAPFLFCSAYYRYPNAPGRPDRHVAFIINTYPVELLHYEAAAGAIRTNHLPFEKYRVGYFRHVRMPR